MIAPGHGFTIFGNLPRDIERAQEAIEASSIVCLHTSADSTDVTSAAIVRRLGCARVWLAIPGNYLSRLDLAHRRIAAIAEATRVGKVARDMDAELLEVNGEGASDGAVVGDWTSEPKDATEAARLESLADELVAAIRAVYAGAVGWTSHDGVRSFAIPRRFLARVDLQSQQHYPAQAGRVVGQRELESRVAWSRGQWEALAAAGKVPADVAPYGAKWSPYGQGHGHSVGAMVWLLCEAPTARLWAAPSSWSPEAVTALRLARRLRSEAGYGPGAIERWQAAHGLTPDGSVGPLTIASLSAP